MKLLTKKKLLTCIFITPIIIGILIVLWIEVNSLDLSDQDTSDLTIDSIQIPDIENAYTYFRESTNSLYWPEDDSLLIDILTTRAWGANLVNQIILNNQIMLNTIDKGLECSVFRGNLYSDNVKPHLKWVQVIRVMELKSMYELKNDNPEKAFELSLNMLRFGSLIISGPGCVTDFKLGLISINRAYQQFEFLLAESDLSEDMPKILFECLKEPLIDLGTKFVQI